MFGLIEWIRDALVIFRVIQEKVSIKLVRPDDFYGEHYNSGRSKLVFSNNRVVIYESRYGNHLGERIYLVFYADHYVIRIKYKSSSGAETKRLIKRNYRDIVIMADIIHARIERHIAVHKTKIQRAILGMEAADYSFTIVMASGWGVEVSVPSVVIARK